MRAKDRNLMEKIKVYVEEYAIEDLAPGFFAFTASPGYAIFDTGEEQFSRI